MKQSIYWKDIRQSITGSKGRFLSILTLMVLGTLALVGLKVTSPNMERTADAYIDQHQMFDLAVMADYGLDKEDQTELQAIQGATVEFGYLLDLTVKDRDQAVRIFSDSKGISTFDLTSGRLPSQDNEIALADFWQKDYSIGQEISFSQKSGSQSILKESSFTITGFVKSADIWSQQDLGYASSGSGTLDAYAVVAESAFDSDVYGIARLRYQDLSGLSAFSKNYRDKLEKHQHQLDQLLADNGEKRLARLKADAEKSIRDGQSQIQQAEAQLDQAQSQLDQQKQGLQAAQAVLPASQVSQSQSQLEAAEKQLEQEREKIQQAQSQVASQKEQLQKSQTALEQLSQPSYRSYSRKTLPGSQGYLMYSNSTASIASVGDIFPVVLYAVAAMVTFTTMTRFVDEERTNAGIFKALGYHSKDIVAKFLIYGLVAGSLGTLLGTLLGHTVLASTISNIITKDSVVGSSQLHLYWSYSLLALLLSLLASVLPAYLVASRELKDEAASLLLPKPPVKGSKIFLERLSFIWKRLSFTHKVTARNIFRYKQRMLMTIFGVAGSVALLFAGLGIQSSLAGVAGRQFGQIIRYDMIVAQNSSASLEEQEQLTALLAEPTVSASRAIFTKQLEEKLSSSSEKASITLMVTDKTDLSPFVQLQEKGQDIQLGEGLVLSQKLADLAGVQVGEQIRLDGKDIKVAAIVENYVGHFAFMTAQSYETTYGQKAANNTYLIRLKDASSASVKKVASQYMALAAVSSVTQNESSINLFNSVAGSLNQTMGILVVVSVLLAIVILYNLTNINVAERIRELSTIKVLGFHNKEVTLYIYRETILLSLVGMGLGLLSGFYLHRFLLQMIAPSTILFYPQVSWDVYAFPIAAVSLILALLGLFVNHHLRKVDMLEALKSVE